MLAGLTVLVVEDNDDLREATLEALVEQGGKALGVDCAEAVPPVLKDQAVDLIVLDLNLPGEDGLVLATRLRTEYPALGIVMTTARTLPQERREGYERGADMYLPKPVSREELVGALMALARRLPEREAAAGLRLERQRALLHGRPAEPIALTPTEVALLVAFNAAVNHQLPTCELLPLLRRAPADDPKRALEITITRLRKKLLQAGAREPAIQAVRGWGYALGVSIAER